MTEQHTIWYYSYIRYLLSNVLLFNAVLSFDHRLPKDVIGIRFVDCYFLKPHYNRHIIKYVSSSAVEAFPYNSKIHYDTLKKMEYYCVIISNYSLFLHINIIFYLKAND